MADQALVVSTLTAAEAAAIEMVLDGLPSEHSRRAYERAPVDFFRWHASAGRRVVGSNGTENRHNQLHTTTFLCFAVLL